MNCESGDQKGKSAPSVCSIRCASGELKALIYKKLLPEASVAAKANVWPSGETAMCSKGCQFRCRRSEEHTSELQSRLHLVCRLLLEKKKKKRASNIYLTPRLPVMYHIASTAALMCALE